MWDDCEKIIVAIVVFYVACGIAVWEVAKWLFAYLAN